MSEANHNIIRRGYRYRLRPKKPQAALLRRFAGCCRFVWNEALKEQSRRHTAGEPYAGYVEMAKWITAWRREPARAFLKEAPVHALQSVVRDLDDAFKRFFAHAGGRPRPKHRGDKISFSEPDRACFAIDEATARVKLPKLGWIRYRQSRPLEGQPRNLTISCDALGWHVAVQTERAAMPAAPVATTIGAGDRGITHFLALADGRKVAPLNAHRKMLQRLRRYQRSCARKVEAQKRAQGITGAMPKGTRLPVSNRLKDARQRLARLQAKIARTRADFLHKLSHELAGGHAAFVLEDLKIRNMSASAAGTAAAPGSRVRQKAGLNRSIMDQGWSEFARQLDYKLSERGGQLIKVNPAYTSQRCSCCGYADAANRRGERFNCLACGQVDHADTNAAKNILAAGHAVLAGKACHVLVRPNRSSPISLSAKAPSESREDAALSGRPMKREPAGETSNAQA